MPFTPTPFEPGTEPLITDVSGATWVPFFEHECTFGPDIFDDVMMNLVKNPNLNSHWLFRADILYDSNPAEDIGDDQGFDKSEGQTGQVDIPTKGRREEGHDGDQKAGGELQREKPRPVEFKDFREERSMVRRFVPRNTRRDDPIDQTCVFLRHVQQPEEHAQAQTPPPQLRSLVVYLPHVSDVDRMPFYHPRVRGVAHLHEWDADAQAGRVSIHYWLFEDEDVHVVKLGRTAQMLLSTLHKHGQGRLAGFVKRVQHDVVIPQARFQDRFLELKLKYARDLVDTWAEVTDPAKHVFEDLCIAAFLIELWADMYKDDGGDTPFPGFVDIGCGNGLLVYILIREGYEGWGFDARARKSWAKYGAEKPPSGREPLKRLVLLPSLTAPPSSANEEEGDQSMFHDGQFPKGTFIISNHADELTPWTPILATQSESPFIMIPCCSCSLGGDKYRAPPPRDKSKSQSTYASLVDWVARIAEDCGWKVETEMLRIPSTRNTGLLGRTRTTPASDVELEEVVRKYGGAGGYFNNAVKLTKTERGH